MRILVNNKNMKIFESLSSETRIKILEILGKSSKNIGELAKLLNFSSAIMTRHITQLEEAGLVRTELVRGKRGMQKMCYLATDEIVLTFVNREEAYNYNFTSIPIGQYVSYKANPTCGLASLDSVIGVWDDPRYFSDPKKVDAAILWFQSGYVEYMIPSYIVSNKKIKSIEISMEICSEFPGYNENWPSDIYFYLNDIYIGYWTSPGDFGKKSGTYTPKWWNLGTKYGLLKTIKINSYGSMIDGLKLSDITIDKIPMIYGKDISFRIEAPEKCNNPGGVTLFGKGFGNYDQDINIRIEYEES